MEFCTSYHLTLPTPISHKQLSQPSRHIDLCQLSRGGYENDSAVFISVQVNITGPTCDAAEGGNAKNYAENKGEKKRKEKKRRSRELSEWHRGRESERKADYKESIAQVEDRQRDWTQRGDRNKDKSGKRTDEAKEVSRGRDRGAGRTW